MSTSSWWSKKLGTEQQQQQPSSARPNMHTTHALPSYAPQSQQPQVTPTNLMEAAGAWNGGEARKETQSCPNCGSNLFFSRSNTGSMPTEWGMATPPPRCYSCGYTVGRPMPGIPS